MMRYHINPVTLIYQIQDVLSPNLLDSRWRKVARGRHPYTGHCYTASEAYYHLWGKKNGFKPHCVELVDDPKIGFVSHWYLTNGTIYVDITREQFKNLPPYSEGAAAAFLTKGPSKQAREIIRRVKMELR
jgi:hypothetical protein